jgi:hypothetical protein
MGEIRTACKRFGPAWPAVATGPRLACTYGSGKVSRGDFKNRGLKAAAAAQLSKGGLILWDLINELGRRLEYKVENGGIKEYLERWGSMGFGNPAMATPSWSK